MSDREEKLSVEERKPESLLARLDGHRDIVRKIRLPRQRRYQMPAQISLIFKICKMKYTSSLFEMRQNQAAGTNVNSSPYLLLSP